MSHRRSMRWLKHGLAVSSLSAVLLSALPTQAAPWSNNRNSFASPRFEQVWRAADLAVQQGQTSRSWTWGPNAWIDYKEFYKQSPSGLRQVQYFDKARMEINNPSNTSGPLGGVTNGLLPVEMISGRVKLGDATTEAENEQRTAAAIPVAGNPAADNPNAPTYASFRNVATTDNAYRDQNKVGQRIGSTFDKNGTIGFRQDLANQAGTDVVAYESVTGHNVPRVFNDFRNNLPGVSALEAFGFPITDPYWITARVGNQDKDIMIQIFERRVLTYTPSNPAAFQVEMGNVGQHYFQWRYPELGQPWVAADPSLPIAFASKRDTTEFNTYTMDGNGNGQSAITGNAKETNPYSMKRSWDPTKTRIFGHSRRYNDKAQLVSMRPDGSDLQRVLTSTANDYNPAVSPDGTKVVFTSDRDGNQDLYMINLGSTAEPTRLTDTVGCVNQYASWLPDGSGIVYESNCQGGNYEIYRANIAYNMDKRNQLEVSRLISPVPAESTRLTNNTSDDRFPRVSPDGSLIAFNSNRDGNHEIYTMAIDGGRQARITNSNGTDEAATWAPDGSRLVFQSNRDGDFEVFIMNRDGNSQIQLTNNGKDDMWAIWAQ
ncbi:MAG TPA: hypothetical protein VGD69_27070 [Herpetosiphonaceae bacterium]